MATLSKTTTNYAERRNIELWVDGDNELSISIIEEDGHVECAEVVYSVQGGEFFFVRNHNNKLEDLPHWIQDEEGLRALVDYISTTI